MFKYFVLVLAFCSLSNAQRLLTGLCPDIATDNEFDVYKFTGKWFVTEATPSFFDFLIKCMSMNYETQKDGSLGISINGLTFGNVNMAIKGDGVIHDTTKNGQYNVRYSFGVPFQGALLTMLDTDYNEYAVLYSCTNSLLPRLLHTDHIWILTKNGILSGHSRQNIYTMLDRLKINRNGITETDKRSCGATWPTNEKGAVVPGQREEEIVSVKSNVTRIESNAVNNIIGKAREEEAPTESSSVKLS